MTSIQSRPVQLERCPLHRRPRLALLGCQPNPCGIAVAHKVPGPGPAGFPPGVARQAGMSLPLHLSLQPSPSTLVFWNISLHMLTCRKPWEFWYLRHHYNDNFTLLFSWEQAVKCFKPSLPLNLPPNTINNPSPRPALYTDKHQFINASKFLRHAKEWKRLKDLSFELEEEKEEALLNQISQ